jgi:succinate-acetate transporter protein
MMPLSNKTSTSGPVLGFLALAPTVALFTLNHGGILHTDPVVMTMLLLIGGTLQVVAGLKSRQSGQMSSAAAFIPLGLFWFSMITLYQLPAMGIGHTSSPLIMLTYLTMWGLFVAILYLASFQQNRVLQMVFGMLMISLLLMAVSEIRDNTVFDIAAAISGVAAGLSAFYTGLAKWVNFGFGRILLPVGQVSSAIDSMNEEQLSN